MPKAAWCSPDTLSLAARKKPRAIIDYATLTGACVYALTERYSGAFTNRPADARYHRGRGRIAAASASGVSRWMRTSIRTWKAAWPTCCNVRPTEGRSHPGGALLEPLRAEGDSLAAPGSRGRARATAGSRTSPRRSRDSACATRSTCCAAAGRARAGMNTLTLRRPDDWHVHLRDGAALAIGGRVHGRALRPRHRHAEPQAARSPRRGGCAAYRERILAALAARQHFRAADDPVPDRQYRAG